jgi:hypothetical protein
VWKSTVNGKVLHFRLTGINNQNFLMRDNETGTWWQQVSGKAVSGPMKGAQLELAPYDELTFTLWKEEAPTGQVLAQVPKDASQYESNWEPEVHKLPTVISFPGTGLESRDVVMGITVNGVSRAYPMPAILAQSPIQDRVGGVQVLLVAGPDKKSIRAFLSRIDGKDAEFFRKTEGTPEWALVDSLSQSEWDFQGCATSGSAQGKCLERLPILKDYWFDWRNYHPDTSVYRH